MNKTIKVLLADTSDFFGVPCAAALRSHEMDVIQVEKDGRKLLERIEADAFCNLAKAVMWPDMPLPKND